MKGSELLRLVWLNINQNRFKAIMTSIGIVVGAATILLVIGIGRGGQMDIAEQFAELNAGAIDITYEYEGEETTSDGGFSLGGMFGGGDMGSAMPEAATVRMEVPLRRAIRRRVALVEMRAMVRICRQEDLAEMQAVSARMEKPGVLRTTNARKKMQMTHRIRQVMWQGKMIRLVKRNLRPKRVLSQTASIRKPLL